MEAEAIAGDPDAFLASLEDLEARGGPAEARSLALPFAHLTSDPDPVSSNRAIRKNGGVLVERLRETAAHGGGEARRWRIGL